MERDFERWPKYKELYIRAFQRMIDNHPGQIKILDPNAEDWLDWWMKLGGKLDHGEPLTIQKNASDSSYETAMSNTPPPEKIAEAMFRRWKKVAMC